MMYCTYSGYSEYYSTRPTVGTSDVEVPYSIVLLYSALLLRYGIYRNLSERKECTSTYLILFSFNLHESILLVRTTSTFHIISNFKEVFDER